MEEILQALLRECNDNPGSSVEDIIKSAISDFDLNEDELNEIEESFKLLEAINAKAIDLSKVRKEGLTRNGWIEKQFGEIAKKSGNDADAILSEIEKGINDGLNNSLNQEI